jgi:hypothetical protein
MLRFWRRGGRYRPTGFNTHQRGANRWKAPIDGQDGAEAPVISTPFSTVFVKIAKQPDGKVT